MYGTIKRFNYNNYSFYKTHHGQILIITDIMITDNLLNYKLNNFMILSLNNLTKLTFI